MKVARSDGASAAVAALADRIAELAESASGDFCIAFSGGESAKSLYPELARRRLDFSRFKIFFADERCVFPDSPDSNYRWARELFLEPLKIRGGRVFRLRGVDCPVDAAEAASKAAAENLPSAGGFPQFDCVVLGIGPDMHTASIFPDTMELLDSPKIYGVCHTKSSEFWRITLTGKAILNAREILAPVLGESKAPVLSRLEASVAAGDFSTPAAAVFGRAKNCTVFAGF